MVFMQTLEVQRGAVLCLGFLIGRLLSRHVRQQSTLQKLKDESHSDGKSLSDTELRSSRSDQSLEMDVSISMDIGILNVLSEAAKQIG
jgi:hypothetical protein